jgi:hypothetical protein
MGHPCLHVPLRPKLVAAAAAGWGTLSVVCCTHGMNNACNSSSRQQQYVILVLYVVLATLLTAAGNQLPHNSACNASLARRHWLTWRPAVVVLYCKCTVLNLDPP